MTCFVCLASGIFGEHTVLNALRDIYDVHGLSVARRNIHDEHTHARRSHQEEQKP